MNPLAITLVLVSVCMHAGWNLIGKRQGSTLAFFAVAMVGAGLVCSPLLVLNRTFLDLPPLFWLVLIASGLSQALYMGGLAWAYARGEISVLYPMIRALPVLLVPIITVFLLGTSRLALTDWLGMALILIGALCLPLSSLRAFTWRTYLTPALGFALLAALGSTGYSILDKAGVDIMIRHGYTAFGAGIHYIVLQTLAIAVWALGIIALMPKERRALIAIRRQQWRMALVTGLMITLTYSLVLMAMALTREVSYVVALRQLSIPLGVLIGIVWLKEGASPLKLLGMAIMLAGLVIVALQ